MLLIQTAHFFLSEWIWSITWGTHHIPINILILVLLIKFFLRVNIIPAILMAISSQFFAFFILSLCAFGAMYFLGPCPGPEKFVCVPTPSNASLCLGLLYACFQIVFFTYAKFRQGISLATLAAIIMISNYLTVLIAWLL